MEKPSKNFLKKEIHNRPLWQWIVGTALVVLLFVGFVGWGAYDGDPNEMPTDGDEVTDEVIDIPEAQGVFTVKSLIEYQDVAKEHYLGKNVEVTGIVKELDTVAGYVGLVDENDPNGEIITCHVKTFVDDVVAGDLVVATGVLTETEGGVELKDTYIQVRKTVEELEKEREKKADEKKETKKPAKKVVPKPSKGGSSASISRPSGNSNPEPKPEEPNETPEPPAKPGNETYTGNGMSVYVPLGYVNDNSGTFTNPEDGSSFSIALDPHAEKTLEDAIAEEATAVGIPVEAVQITDRGYRYNYAYDGMLMTVDVIFTPTASARLTWQIPPGVDVTGPMNESMQSFQLV